LRELRGHASWVYSVAWAPFGSVIASGSGDPQGVDRSVRLWDPMQGLEIGRVDRAHNDVIHAIAWDPAGPRFATASADETVNLWMVGGL